MRRTSRKRNKKIDRVSVSNNCNIYPEKRKMKMTTNGLLILQGGVFVFVFVVPVHTNALGNQLYN